MNQAVQWYRNPVTNHGSVIQAMPPVFGHDQGYPIRLPESWEPPYRRKSWMFPPRKKLKCRNGFDLLLQDMTLFSTILAYASLGLAGVSLFVSNFYNFFGSLQSVIWVALPSLVVNALALAGVTFPIDSPYILFLTIASIVDALNNAFNIVPGSIFSDFVGLVSLKVGKIGTLMGTAASYPILLKKALKKVGIRKLHVDRWYGCGFYTPGKVLEDFLNNIDVEW